MWAWVATVLVFLVGIAVLVVVSLFVGPRVELGGDTRYFLALAQSLAHGKGYCTLNNLPAYGRMPGWPGLMALGLWLAPAAPPLVVMRLTNAAILALAGTFFCILARQLGTRAGASVAAGLALSLSPLLVYLSVTGWSEVSFVLFLAMGLVGLFAGGWRVYLGALSLGLAALVRENFILVPALVVVLALLVPAARRSLMQRERLARTLVALAIAYALPLLWLARNYHAAGRFPLLSSLEGETLYGANNDVTANRLEAWGYWIMPDGIPGETPRRQLLAAGASALDLNDYYHRKAIIWIRNNLRALPRLELGKLVRGFAPIPWEPVLPGFIAFSYRFLLWILFIALWRFWWPRMKRAYVLLGLSMFLVNLLTVLMYYGCSRFTHCFVEILFIPCICLGLDEALKPRSYSTQLQEIASQPEGAAAVPLVSQLLT